MGRIVLYIGGARSGKSRLAQERAGSREPVAYVATATRAAHDGTIDPEMDARIQRHRADRPAAWKTIEEPRDLAKAFQLATGARAQCILLDCLTLWLSNRVLELFPDRWNNDVEKKVLDELENALHVAKNSAPDLVLVSNELGGGLVPEYPLGRIFRDVHGRMNQRVASISDEVQWVVAGLAVKMK